MNHFKGLMHRTPMHSAFEHSSNSAYTSVLEVANATPIADSQIALGVRNTESDPLVLNSFTSTLHRVLAEPAFMNLSDLP